MRIIELKELFFIDDPGKLCRLPYPGHPKGCPNWNRSPNCPPHAARIEEKYNLKKHGFFIIRPFDIAAQKTRMKSIHPDWSDKQCGCSRYWQNGIKKELHDACKEFIFELHRKNNNMYTAIGYNIIPEAMGLDVFKTARYHGIRIVRNPQKILFKIAFVGVLR